MIERRKFPTAWEGCEISVVTEKDPDGRWAVVASIVQTSEDAVRNIDLPVIDRRFESQADAEDFGLRQAEHWLERNELRPRRTA